MKAKTILLLMGLVSVLVLIRPALARARDPYADTVISYGLGPGVGDARAAPPNGNDNPSAALGAPESSHSGSGLFVSLGEGGWIILGFTDNFIDDGVGNDFTVYEIGSAENGEVYASADGVTFLHLGIASGTESFDLASVGLSSAVAVKIVDIPPHTTGSPYAGFDLDAVEALNSGVTNAHAREPSSDLEKHVLPWGSWNPSAEELAFVASHFDVVNVGTRANSAKVRQLKALNPNIVVLIYLDAVASAGIDRSLLYERDYVHDVDGNRLVRKAYGFEVRNPGSEHWRRLWAERALEVCNEYNADGIFADDVWTVLWEGSFTGKPSIPQSTKDNWYSNMKGFLSYVKSQLGAHLLIPNTPDNGEFVDICDGKWEESFVHARWADYGNYRDFDREVGQLRDVCKSGKLILVSGGCYELERDKSWTQAHPNQVKRLLEYCFCSYLLGVSGDKSAFNFGSYWNRDGSSGYYPIFDEAKQLGSPVNDYNKFGSVYARDFENGKVLVNPASSSYTISLGENYKTLDDQVISSITLKGHTGIILLGP